MSLFDRYKPKYNTSCVKETLEHATKPKLSQTKLFSMEPAGYAGSVYEDPRGYSILKAAGILGVALGVVVLLIVGNLFFSAYARSFQPPEVMEALADQSQQDIPVIASYMYWNDEDVVNNLSENHTVYQYNANSTGINCVGVSPTVSKDALGAIYLQGLNNVSLAELAQVLQTGWFLSTGHNEGNNIKVKYADFVSAGEVPAINAAIQQQGLGAGEVLATGIDENENTYSYGTIYVESADKNLYWMVAACPLSEVYSVNGLPNNSVYVGITIADYELMIIEDTQEEN